MKKLISSLAVLSFLFVLMGMPVIAAGDEPQFTVSAGSSAGTIAVTGIKPATGAVSTYIEIATAAGKTFRYEKLRASQTSFTYKNLTPGNEYTITVTSYGTDTKLSETSKKQKASQISASGLTISNASNRAYTGKALGQSLVVKYGGSTLKNGTDYVVSYKNNINTGIATATVTGKGKYTGSKNITFKIVPKKEKISYVKKAGSKKLKVKWTRDKQASGYQIEYSRYKNFKNDLKVTIKKNSTTSKTVKCSYSKRQYYVRVRAYKTINGKKYYGAWSKAVKQTTR